MTFDLLLADPTANSNNFNPSDRQWDNYDLYDLYCTDENRKETEYAWWTDHFQTLLTIYYSLLRWDFSYDEEKKHQFRDFLAVQRYHVTPITFDFKTKLIDPYLNRGIGQTLIEGTYSDRYSIKYSNYANFDPIPAAFYQDPDLVDIIYTYQDNRDGGGFWANPGDPPSPSGIAQELMLFGKRIYYPKYPCYTDFVTGYKLDDRRKPTTIEFTPEVTETVTISFYRQNPYEQVNYRNDPIEPRDNDNPTKRLITADWFTYKRKFKAGKTYKLSFEDAVFGTVNISSPLIRNIVLNAPSEPNCYDWKYFLVGQELPLFEHWEQLHAQKIIQIGNMPERPLGLFGRARFGDINPVANAPTTTIVEEIDGSEGEIYGGNWTNVNPNASNAFQLWANSFYALRIFIQIFGTSNVRDNQKLTFLHWKKSKTLGRVLHKLAANNNYWNNDNSSNSDINVEANHPMFKVDNQRTYNWYFKPQPDGSFGDLVMDSPRTIQIYEWVRRIVAAFEIETYWKMPDSDEPRTWNLGKIIYESARILGLRRKPDGTIDQEAEKGIYLRRHVEGSDENNPQEYALNGFGSKGAIVRHLPNRRTPSGDTKAGGYRRIHDIPQLLAEYHEQANKAVGYQEGTAIEINIDKEKYVFPNQLALLTDLFVTLKQTQAYSKGAFFSSIVGEQSIKEVMAGLGLRTVDKFLEFEVAGKVAKLYYKGISASQSLRRKLSALATNIGIINGNIS